MNILYHEGYTQNRDMSWLRFNERILEEACDINVPLIERLRYIQIFSKNLDEFYMVRVAEIIDEVEEAGNKVDSLSGMSSADQLREIDRMAKTLLERKDDIYSRLMSELEHEGIVKLEYSMLTEAELSYTRDYFESSVRPLLDERVIEKEKLSDFLGSAPYIIGTTSTEQGERFCITRVPAELPPALVFEHEGGGLRYMLLETLIKGRFDDVFAPFRTTDVTTMVITRECDVDIEDSGDLLKDMKKVVSKRKFADIDRIVLDRRPNDFTRRFLSENLQVKDWQIYVTKRASFDFVDYISDFIRDDEERFLYRRFTPFNQLSLVSGGIIDEVKKNEILSAYPFDSMDPFLKLLEEAALDSRVVEIRMTIYRLARNSVIAEHLMAAAQNGKKVKLMIELRARFDEGRNIEWIEKLEKAGCIVRYANDDYKVHCKLCQIKLEENGRKYFITQLGTGNYNEKSAKIYTDFSLITADRRIGEDADRFFRDLFKQKIGDYKHLAVSPVTLSDTVISLIRREASKKKKGRIFIKCNSLGDREIMEELMKASQKGCRIVLLVRGVCCLLPGVKDSTENIKVVNLVGRFLEHSRVYMFGEGKDEVMYIASADMMKRNLHKRVELACPVYSRKNRDRIRSMMYLNVMDNVKGRVMRPDGTYAEKAKGEEMINSQKILAKYSSVN